MSNNQQVQLCGFTMHAAALEFSTRLSQTLKRGVVPMEVAQQVEDATFSAEKVAALPSQNTLRLSTTYYLPPQLGDEEATEIATMCCLNENRYNTASADKKWEMKGV